jgi:hypothetical protein
MKRTTSIRPVVVEGTKELVARMRRCKRAPTVLAVDLSAADTYDDIVSELNLLGILDPPCGKNINFDAFSDSLYSGSRSIFFKNIYFFVNDFAKFVENSKLEIILDLIFVIRKVSYDLRTESDPKFRKRMSIHLGVNDHRLRRALP